ncbi:hypothetical protein RIF29_18879 [Crotalaria pallida]|uniref:Uncharacterized protein n=1 Tax=Crotalaria pallida TaxID=3830 RepID=A0AAN9EYD8_CROPI
MGQCHPYGSLVSGTVFQALNGHIHFLYPRGVWCGGGDGAMELALGSLMMMMVWCSLEKKKKKKRRRVHERMFRAHLEQRGIIPSEMMDMKMKFTLRAVNPIAGLIHMKRKGLPHGIRLPKCNGAPYIILTWMTVGTRSSFSVYTSSPLSR